MKPLARAIDLAEQKGLSIISRDDFAQDKWIPLGYILAPHGLRGGVKAHLFNEETNSIYVGAKLGLLLESGQLIKVKLTGVTSGPRLIFAHFENRDEAESLKRATIMVERGKMSVLPKDEVYLVDLLGAQAVDIDGKILGTVNGFSDNSAQPLVEITTPAGENVLLPFVTPILHRIEEKERKIIFDPPDGFF